MSNEGLTEEGGLCSLQAVTSAFRFLEVKRTFCTEIAPGVFGTWAHTIAVKRHSAEMLAVSIPC